jgi:hypothetical protein
MESLKGVPIFIPLISAELRRASVGRRIVRCLPSLGKTPDHMRLGCDTASYINGTIGCFGFEGYGMGEVKKFDALLL